MCKLELQNFKTFKSYIESDGDLRYFVFNELPDDGTLVPKNVGVRT